MTRRSRVHRLLGASAVAGPLLAAASLRPGDGVAVRPSDGGADSCARAPASPGRSRLPAPSDIALDPNDTLYVASFADSSVSVFAPGASGDAAPVRTLGGRGAGWPPALAVALGPRGRLYVAHPSDELGAVATYAPGSSGAVRPTRTLAGPKTRLNKPAALALDQSGTLYVANDAPFTSTILTFGPRASGETPPLRVLGGEPRGYERPRGLAVDVAGRLYVASAGSIRGIDAYGPDLGAVLVYAAGAEGAAAPVREIRGYHTRLNSPYALALDHDTLYVANLWDHRAGSVTVYGPAATGDVAPVRMLRGSATALCAPTGVAVDRHGALYVANATTGAVTVYPPGANGDAAPMRTLGGP